MLLGLESVHVHRQFRGCHEVRHEDEAPAVELRAVAEVEILRQCVVLPAACVLDGGAAPEARSAVEVKEPSAAASGRLFEQEVTIEEHGLHAREQGILAVQVPPARLDHPDLRIGEEMHGALQDVGRRNEVCVEDEDELARAGLHSVFERTGLEACAIRAVDQLHIEPLRRQFGDHPPGDVRRFVGGIVEQLHLEQLPRVIERRHGPQQPLHHIQLIEDRQLHCDPGQFLESRNGLRDVFAVLQKEINDDVAMQPVER